ncbi:hypothetical protein EDD22DRAFT_778819, partial [Suillus occidentalis]
EPAVFSMAAYITFIDGIQQEITEFKQRQVEGTAREEARETELLREWQEQKAAKVPLADNLELTSADVGPNSTSVTSSMSVSVWKIKCQSGDVIQSADDILVILEAMKTEINILAEEKVGKAVKSLGKGIREGASVQVGDVLAWFE